jgi:integrase
MVAKMEKTRRPRGTGSLTVHRDSGGRETWYGSFYVGGRRVKRRIGPKRETGTRKGLTRTQAEAALRRLNEDAEPAPPVVERLTVEEAGERYLRELESLGRKPSTMGDYRSTLRVHLAPFFGEKALNEIHKADVRDFMVAKRREGKAAKSIRNWLSLLHSIFAFAEEEGWARGNPVKLVKKGADEGDADVRFLDHEELEALLRAVPEDVLGGVEGPLYLTAAMTGLRQGELFALRWRDVDWSAGRLRVRRNYVRGEYGTPKSKRGSRSVPLADRVAGELERHFQRSHFQHDDDLVFPHPHTGKPLDRSKVLKRFKQALSRARVREVRFHDLRHTFGTRMAAAGVPMRTLQEWMGHRDSKTTEIYADYQPGGQEAELVERAFSPRGSIRGTKLSETEVS